MEKKAIFSAEHRRRLSDSHKGHEHSKETRKKMSVAHKGLNTWMKGRRLTEETRKKMSVARDGRGGKPFTKELLARLTAFHKGRKQPREQIEKRSKKLRGELHWNWKGGISRNAHSLNRPEYKEWRSKVFERDSWTCQTCRERGGFLEAHHIKSWAKFPELRYVVDNGVTLCRGCHALIDKHRARFMGKSKK